MNVKKNYLKNLLKLTLMFKCQGNEGLPRTEVSKTKERLARNTAKSAHRYRLTLTETSQHHLINFMAVFFFFQKPVLEFVNN